MAQRTSDAQCEQICHVTAADGIVWTGFIAEAVSLTDAVEANDTDSTLSDATLELIERNLACWARGVRDQYLASDSKEGASAQFQGQTGMYFSSNFYGQKAMLLDRTGYLRILEKQAQDGPLVASAEWLGSEYKDDASKDATNETLTWE